MGNLLKLTNNKILAATFKSALIEYQTMLEKMDADFDAKWNHIPGDIREEILAQYLMDNFGMDPLNKF